MEGYSKPVKCSTENCQGAIQATCSECRLFYCFSCSLKHAQKQPLHCLEEFDTAIKGINEKSQELLKRLKGYANEAAAKKERQKQEQKLNNPKGKSTNEGSYDERLNPEKFQEQLNYITTIEK
jgi:hypothetical protein